MTKINWDDLEAEYIAGDMSYRELAKAHKLSKSAVSKAGKERNWTKKRDNYRTNVAQASLHNARIKQISNNTDRLNSLIDTADQMTLYLNDIMYDKDQFTRLILRDGEGGEYVSDTNKIDTRAVRDVVHAIAELSGAVKGLNEILNPIDKQRIAADKQRMEIEKRKADADSSISKDINVNIVGGDKDWMT